MKQLPVKRINLKEKSKNRLYSFRIMTIAFFASVFFLMVSCDPDAQAVSGRDVNIKIKPVIISSGFMQFELETDQNAYYHVGIVPKADAPDLSSNADVRAFMNLKLDEAYTNYVLWRHSLLEESVPYIAEFSTHSLQYGKVEYNFTMLEPGTDYIIFAFVVDSKTNKPDGRLFIYNASTTVESIYEDLQFEYRVRGYWDYCYPVFQSRGRETTEIVDFVPWIGATVDSLQARQFQSASVPDYFSDLFGVYIGYKLSDYIHFGIYAQNNNGISDGTSEIWFEEGHTYYTAFALMDGYLFEENIVIYKFYWKDQNTQLFFTKDQRLTTDW